MPHSAIRSGSTLSSCRAQRDRRPPVVELGLVVDELARLAVARAEVPVVEHERGQARGGEALGVRVEALLADAVEAVADHDAGHRFRAGRAIVPGGAPSALALDDEVITPH